jgi:hypothetical protein
MAGMPWAGAKPRTGRSIVLPQMRGLSRPHNTIAPPSCPRAASLPLESRFLCKYLFARMISFAKPQAFRIMLWRSRRDLRGRTTCACFSESSSVPR